MPRLQDEGVSHGEGMSATHVGRALTHGMSAPTPQKKQNEGLTQCYEGTSSYTDGLLETLQ